MWICFLWGSSRFIREYTCCSLGSPEYWVKFYRRYGAGGALMTGCCFILTNALFATIHDDQRGIGPLHSPTIRDTWEGLSASQEACFPRPGNQIYRLTSCRIIVTSTKNAVQVFLAPGKGHARTQIHFVTLTSHIYFGEASVILCRFEVYTCGLPPPWNSH